MRQKILVAGLGQQGSTFTNKLMDLGVKPEHLILVDVNPAKIEAARSRWPAACYLDRVHEPTYDQYHNLVYGLDQQIEDVGAAIVATSTPSHHVVGRSLIRSGVSNILIEKPLAMGVGEARELTVWPGNLHDAPLRVFCALLINFSPALRRLIDYMEEHDLVFMDGSSVWCKNRTGDTRPTPGDSDEVVHPLMVFYRLARVNRDRLHRTSVTSRLTYPRYANRDAQREAQRIDSSFPLTPAASSFVVGQTATSHGLVNYSITSSFVAPQQERSVTLTLCKRTDTAQLGAMVRLDFDTRGDDGIKDTLRIVTPGKDAKPLVESFQADKMEAQTKAFLRACQGDVDPMLTGFDEAYKSVLLSNAIEAANSTDYWMPVQ